MENCGLTKCVHRICVYMLGAFKLIAQLSVLGKMLHQLSCQRLNAIISAKWLEKKGQTASLAPSNGRLTVLKDWYWYLDLHTGSWTIQFGANFMTSFCNQRSHYTFTWGGQSPVLVDLGTAHMLHAHWLTDADEINYTGIEIWYQMTRQFWNHDGIEAFRS